MKILVRFSEEADNGRVLGDLRDLMKAKAGLTGLQVRKRRSQSALVSGAGNIHSAMLLLVSNFTTAALPIITMVIWNRIDISKRDRFTGHGGLRAVRSLMESIAAFQQRHFPRECSG